MIDPDDISATPWDAIIVGTGVTESLTAAALSRAGYHVLHIDKNFYYGDAQATLTIDEAKVWVENVNAEVSSYYPFTNAVLEILKHEVKIDPRLPCLSLSPEIVYSTSSLLPLLISSGLHQSLEFLKTGDWFVARDVDIGSSRPQSLTKVPSGREDIFKDKSIGLKDKRSIVRILKSVSEGSHTQDEVPTDQSIYEYASKPPNSVPHDVMDWIASLTLSFDRPDALSQNLAFTNIQRHLKSIGRLGAGFGAVTIKYGGGSELAQVFCRAAAVAGGGIYVLGTGLQIVSRDVSWSDFEGNKRVSDASNAPPASSTKPGISVVLDEGKQLWTAHLVGSYHNLSTCGASHTNKSLKDFNVTNIRRNISVVSDPLDILFDTQEPPTAAAAIVYYPAESLHSASKHSNHYPITIIAHSSDLGECSYGQSVLHTFMRASASISEDDEFIRLAVKSLIASCLDREDVLDTIQLRLSFTQRSDQNKQPEVDSKIVTEENFHYLPLPPLEIAFPDVLVEHSKHVYEKIAGTRQNFMQSTINQNALSEDD